MLDSQHIPKAPDCDVEIFRTGYPPKEFVRISRIDVHIERTYYMRSDFDNALPMLRKEACESGADAIIEITERSSHINLSETNIYHITGSGIRYQKKVESLVD